MAVAAIIVIVLFIWLSQAAATSLIAKSKGRNSFVWYWLGLLLPFVALLLVSIINPSAAYLAARRKCPHCAELIRDEAKVCKHCGRALAPMEPRVVTPSESKEVPKRHWFWATVFTLLVVFVALVIGA